MVVSHPLLTRQEITKDNQLRYRSFKVSLPLLRDFLIKFYYNKIGNERWQVVVAFILAVDFSIKMLEL